MALQTQFAGAPAARGALPPELHLAGDCPNFRLSEKGTVPFDSAAFGPASENGLSAVPVYKWKNDGA